jgi:ubiquinone/menaquinone biosynthesis C-methylase UbiE
MGHSLRRDMRFWDRAAARYASSPIADKGGYERSLQATRDRLTSDDRVLEIGCGTGTTALRLAPHAGYILATDLSGEMIAIARQKSSAEPFRNFRFEVGAVSALELEPDSFDAVLAFNLLHLVASLETCLAEIYRALKPGGQFISKTPCLSLMSPLIGVAVPVMKVLGKAPSVKIFAPGQLEAAIAGAGFENIEIEWHGTRGKDIRPFIVARKGAGLS